MSGQSPSRADTLWALAAAIPFLVSIGLFAYAVARQDALAFAIGWPILQAIGYAGALKRSGGMVDHPLVKSQVFIHWIMLVFLVVMIGRAT